MNTRLLIVEAVITLLLLALCLVRPSLALQAGSKIFRTLGQIARRRILSAIAVGCLALVLRISILPLMPAPEPQVHDEFSYLLAADTFASGRLTNPPHPLWIYFETFHVNQRPTYASMYPPAQGLAIAAGNFLIGQPWVGVLLSVSLMCVALYWMLQGWLPARWALLGALIAVIRIATFTYWGNSYWGGAVAAAGGALVLGALPRLLRRIRLHDALALGVGVIILANSRPYEGLLLCGPVAIALVLRFKRGSILSAQPHFKKSALLLLLLILSAGSLMGYYFWRVTGSPVRMPYQINQQTYQMARALVWQKPTLGIQYRHKKMRDYYEVWLQEHHRVRSSLQGFLGSLVRKILSTWLFFIGPILSVSLLGLSRCLLDRRIRWLVVIGVVGALGLSAESWFFPHYASPYTSLLYALMLQSMRRLRLCRSFSKPIGASLVMVIPLICVVMFALALITLPTGALQGRAYGAWCCAQTGPSERSLMLKGLTADGNRHLVIVQYAGKETVTDTWVHNGADVDNSQVVFARDLGIAGNVPLTNYFADRKIWLLKVESDQVNLVPYPIDIP